ncbi:MAG: hypothetical protein M3R17_18200 [Bacteroidota bacterium]|nr:hypothetical protein [Bacteroidota bacterium]
MRKSFWNLFCNLLIPCAVFCQDKKEDSKSWTTQPAYTKQLIRDSADKITWSGLNGIGIRFISPCFKLETEDDYWTEEEEKDPGKFKRARFLFEVMYGYKYRMKDIEVTEISSNASFVYRLFNYKLLSINAIGGLKFFFLYNRDYGLLNFKKIYYWEYGASAQLDLGFVVPFIEIKRFKYCTFGMELRLHPVYKKPKRKYHIHKKRFPVS